MKASTPKNIDEYLADFPATTRAKLEEIRAIIRAHAPQATETINYGIPTFKLNGNLVHFAGYAKHVGFYPGAEALAHFREKISGYKSAKGSVQFPLDQPLPAALIAEIVTYRVANQQAKNSR